MLEQGSCLKFLTDILLTNQLLAQLDQEAWMRPYAAVQAQTKELHRDDVYHYHVSLIGTTWCCGKHGGRDLLRVVPEFEESQLI